MKHLLPGGALSVEMLPRIGDRNAIFKFAMTFDGYEHYGSFEAAAQKARERSRSTLTEIRNELFLSARGSRHRDDDNFIDVYVELLPFFKEQIEKAKQ